MRETSLQLIVAKHSGSLKRSCKLISAMCGEHSCDRMVQTSSPAEVGLSSMLFLSLAPICRWLILRDWRPVLWTRFTMERRVRQRLKVWQVS